MMMHAMVLETWMPQVSLPYLPPAIGPGIRLERRERLERQRLFDVNFVVG